MKKLLSKIFHILGIAACVLFGLMAVLAVMGYFISRSRFRDPVEEYALVGSRVYTRAPAMMVDEAFDSLRLGGRDVRIGVLDTGFGGLRERRWTRNLHVAAYADFVDGDTTGFFVPERGRERDHGAYSLACMGGCVGDTVKGLAWAAEYYLAEVDDFDREPRAEEERMMAGIRWLLAHDVDIISSSIGYTVFDDYDGYTPGMLDGRSSRISRFVDSVLTVHPDLIFVVSVGNEGDGPWRYNSFPSDVREAIAVGQVAADGVTREALSSVGWDGVPYVKPDLCAYVPPPRRGTSFAAPAVAGLCGALLEWRRMGRAEMVELLHAAGTNASAPDREVGYGVPQTARMHLQPEAEGVRQDAGREILKTL